MIAYTFCVKMLQTPVIRAGSTARWTKLMTGSHLTIVLLLLIND